MINLTIGGKTKRSKFEPRPVEIDFDKLPEASRDFVIRYGLKQYLADGVAAAESQADFDTGIGDRLTKLEKADFSRTRTDKAPVDDVETLAMNLAKEAVRAAAKAKGAKLDKERVAELAKGLLAGTKGQDYLDEAKRQIDARKAMDVDLGALDAEALGIA